MLRVLPVQLPLGAVMSYRPMRMKFGAFLAPFHDDRMNPTLALESDMELVCHMDRLGFDEAWNGEHHPGAFDCIRSPAAVRGGA